jgi:precorrin-4/cobalt-precorrin-4 C11-methyltransferase
MIYFIGAGPGAKDLITVRGKELLENADVVIYAGSLVNEELLEYCKSNAEIHNSAKMTLEEVLTVMKKAEQDKKTTVRLHTGDPCLYGAIREQMDELDKLEIVYESVPGVSSFCGAAASLNLEYTLPDVSQTVIITRLEGRTAVPEKEKLTLLAQHKASLVLFLSSGMTEKVQKVLLEAGISSETPAALVYKATWKDEKRLVCTVGTLAQTAKENEISKTALIIVGDVVAHSSYSRSKLYDPSFTTEFRKGSSMENSPVLE